MLGIYASISQFCNTGRGDRVNASIIQLNSMFSNDEEDPLGLFNYERYRSEIDPKKSNVGNATRKLIINGFKEFFRDEGETPFAQCWEQAKY